MADTDCSGDLSGYVRDHAPHTPHPPECQIPGCTAHPEYDIVWPRDPAMDVTQDILAVLRLRVPETASRLWVCFPHAAMIGATLAAHGHGHHVLIGGTAVSRMKWVVAPVPADTLRSWLTAARTP